MTVVAISTCTAGVGTWSTALDSAGLPKRTPYSLRHTFASFAIAGGVLLFYLARRMGSSVDRIDAVYGHLLPDSEDYLRGLLDTYDINTKEEASASYVRHLSAL